MWTWVIIVAGYGVSLFAFQLLGGIGAAGRALESWGRNVSLRRVDESGLTPEGFARSQLGAPR